VRLKELERVEKIADKVAKITAVGGLSARLERTSFSSPFQLAPNKRCSDRSTAESALFAWPGGKGSKRDINKS
jgi:hypothetical protein